MMNNSFQHKITIPFQDIDAAGIVFYAHLFRYTHEAYEQFMSKIGFSLVDIIREKKYLIPLVHAEADYHIALGHGDNVTVLLNVEKIGTSSFTLVYVFMDEQGNDRAIAKTVHVVLNAQDKNKISIPDNWQQGLRAYVAAV